MGEVIQFPVNRDRAVNTLRDFITDAITQKRASVIQIKNIMLLYGEGAARSAEVPTDCLRRVTSEVVAVIVRNSNERSR